MSRYYSHALKKKKKLKKCSPLKSSTLTTLQLRGLSFLTPALFLARNTNVSHSAGAALNSVRAAGSGARTLHGTAPPASAQHAASHAIHMQLPGHRWGNRIPLGSSNRIWYKQSVIAPVLELQKSKNEG